MRPRRLALLLAAAGLGAAAAVLPAAAGSEGVPSVEAINRGGAYGEYHYWSPERVTVVPGGSVSFSNPTAVPHGIQWKEGPGGTKPACAGSVPVEASGTSWSGTCTFTQAGVYTYWCTVHGAAMAGTITVETGGTTASTPATTGSPTSTQPSTPAGGGSTTGAGPSSPGAAALTSPFAGPHPIALAAGLHGHSVRGSVNVSQAGAGGRLLVEALAARASLAAARAATGPLVVGRLLRSSVAPGRVAFAVGLSQRALRALRRHGHLTLVLRATLTPPGASTVSSSRRLTLHR